MIVGHGKFALANEKAPVLKNQRQLSKTQIVFKLRRRSLSKSRISDPLFSLLQFFPGLPRFGLTLFLARLQKPVQHGGFVPANLPQPVLQSAENHAVKQVVGNAVRGAAGRPVGAVFRSAIVPITLTGLGVGHHPAAVGTAD